MFHNMELDQVSVAVFSCLDWDSIAAFLVARGETPGFVQAVVATAKHRLVQFPRDKVLPPHGRFKELLPPALYAIEDHQHWHHPPPWTDDDLPWLVPRLYDEASFSLDHTVAVTRVPAAWKSVKHLKLLMFQHTTLEILGPWLQHDLFVRHLRIEGNRVGAVPCKNVTANSLELQHIPDTENIHAFVQGIRAKTLNLLYLFGPFLIPPGVAPCVFMYHCRLDTAQLPLDITNLEVCACHGSFGGMSRFANLKRLDLSTMTLTLPEEFATMQQLDTIHLTHVTLRGPWHLPRVTSLTIQDCGLVDAGVLPAVMFNLTLSERDLGGMSALFAKFTGPAGLLIVHSNTRNDAETTPFARVEWWRYN